MLHTARLVYHPQIPESVIRYYLNRGGFETEDSRILRVVALAAHKFVSDVAHESMQQLTLRNKRGKNKKEDKFLQSASKTLSMQDLSQALKKYGVRVDQPPDLYAASNAEHAADAAADRRKRAAAEDSASSDTCLFIFESVMEQWLLIDECQQ